MNEKLEITFEAARDTTNRIITLSSSMILVMVTFSKDFIASAEFLVRILASAAWIAFGLSTLCGVYTLLALTGEIALEDRNNNSRPSVWRDDIRVVAGGQILLFGAGLLLSVVFAVKAIL